jgi:hypothetical protein
VAGAGRAGLGAPPPFHSSISAVTPPLRSWHRGCPVAISRLRLLHLSYWGFDGQAHEGKLIVAARWALPAVAVFRRLYASRFPIRRMQPIDVYGGNDDRSDAADNSSGFNCRFVKGTRTWSEHAWGRAIDVNPLENPEIQDGVFTPPAGRRYTDRSRWLRGMVHPHDRVVRAFAAIGWHWGGYWHSLKDYMHFSATGR